MRWNLNNGVVEMLIKYGGFYDNAPYQGSSIQYDGPTGCLVISGLVANSTLSKYGGGFDGFVLIYDKHLSLTDTLQFGGSGNDLGSTIELPYVLLSVVSPADL